MVTNSHDGEVFQMVVTMDYSIFLWESYNEQRVNYSDNKEAMAVAMQKTLTSVVGSSAPPPCSARR